MTSRSLKIWSVIGIVAFCSIEVVQGAIYEFGGSTTRHTIRFEVYLDGNLSSLSSHNVAWQKSNSSLIMDVDVQALTTTMLEFHASNTEPILRNHYIYEGGFGGFEIPYVIQIQDSSFNALIQRGPYDIDPQTLGFSAGGKLYDQQGDIMTANGYIEIEGQQFNFNLNQNMDIFGGDNGQFNDSEYPEQLGLSWGGNDWRSETDVKILDTQLQGYHLEMYVGQWSNLIDTGNWVGVPEPSTLFLLGLGALMLRRKR